MYNKLSLIRVPDYSGFVENKEANRLARESARISFTSPEAFCDTRECTYKKEFREKGNRKKQSLAEEPPTDGSLQKFLRGLETATALSPAEASVDNECIGN